MKPDEIMCVPPVWRALVSELNGGRVSDGYAGIRDVDNPCEAFAPVGAPWVQSEGTGRCETDGHYLCSECTEISLEEVRRRRDLCQDCGTALVLGDSLRGYSSREAEVCPSCAPEELPFAELKRA